MKWTFAGFSMNGRFHLHFVHFHLMITHLALAGCYLCTMRKHNFTFGIIMSIGIALIGVSLRSVSGVSISIEGVIRFILYTLGFSIICLFAHTFLVSFTIKKISKKHNQYFIGIACVLLVSFLIFPFNGLFEWVCYVFKLKEDVPTPHEESRFLLLFTRGIAFSSFMFFVVYYIQLLQEKQRRIVEIEKLTQAQLEANLSNLKEQLNPHFLFNTLNSLSSLTEDDTIKDYIGEIANVYRYMLMHNKMSTVTLQQELDFVQSYLYIMKTRMAGAIDIQIDIDKQLMNHKIPPLTLQLLVENAFKHNIASNSNPLRIKITQEGMQRLIVQNNYQPKKQVQTSTGIGLTNLMKRYRILFHTEIEIVPDAKNFTVKLPINRL